MVEGFKAIKEISEISLLAGFIILAFYIAAILVWIIYDVIKMIVMGYRIRKLLKGVAGGKYIMTVTKK